ncbi:MAG: hypothetical protein OXF50_24565 [Caldilineaceae bacterium]|nr:hypothetical protein [Caldilineaceae bacterium]
MKYLQPYKRPNPNSFRARFARLRRSLRVRYRTPLHFLLILGLVLPAAYHVQQRVLPPRLNVQDGAQGQPLSGLALPPAGDGPSLRVPPGEPRPEPDLMLASGALSFDVSTVLLRPDEPFTVSVRVDSDPGPSTEGSILSLQLDPALELHSGQSEWKLPDVAAPFSQQLTLQAPQAQLGDVFKLTASIERAGFAPQTRTILLGVESGQPLAVLLDPEKSDAGTRVAVRELDLAAAGGQQMMRAWEVEAATARSRRVESLSAPATLVFDARPLIVQGIDPHRIGLFTRADSNEDWQPVISRYRPQEQRFVARVDRFSQWGLGEKLTEGADLLPSRAVSSSDGFTGYAQISIPIAAPAGLGGMKPGLSLSYSSGVADDLESLHGASNYKTQANWVGYGWSLGGLSHVARTNDGNIYSLNMGGVGARILKRDNRWITDPDRFLKLEHTQEWSGRHIRDGHTRYDVDDWVITAPDGTVYHFGSNQFAPPNSPIATQDGEPIGNWTEIIFRSNARQGNRWHLRMVEDPNGNRIEYDYDVENEEAECRSEHHGRFRFAGDDKLYDRMVYPSEIRWSANAGAGIESKLRVRFLREERPDHELENDDRCAQLRFGKERLKRIVVEAWDNPNGWHSIAEYEFGYIQGSNHSLLSSLTRKGKQGEETLRAWTFGYAGSGNAVRLTEADNGFGGSVSFSYGMEKIEACHDCNRVTDDPMRRPVTRIVRRDGTGGEAHTVYAYSGVKGVVKDGMFEYLGHAWSQRRIYTVDSDLNIPGPRFEQAVAGWYHQILENDLRKLDDRRGRRYQREVYSPADGLMQREEISWGVHESKNESPWVRMESESVYTFDGDGDDNAHARHTYYFYEAAFGNVIRVEERDAEGEKVLRKTETEYSRDRTLLDRHIGGRPTREWVSDERGRCIAETRYSYDAAGNLTRGEQPTTECGESDAANLIVSRVEYDSVGNVTRSWTEGTSSDIRTEFDAVFKLFPTRRYNANDNTLDETGKYYGINGDDSRVDGGFWGTMQEFCAVDGICTQQAYDDFARASHRWEKGVGYPDRARAQTQWLYHAWGSMGQNANVIVTQGLPRCEGNFSRKLYDGFGQLFQEQSPRQGWETAQDGCSAVENQLETVVNYGYDGLGRLLRTSVPRAVVFDWVHETDWGQGYTATTYDGLSRPISTRAPNGSVTTYHYKGLTSSVIASSEGEETSRMLSWQQQDQLGRTTLLRSYAPGTDEWTLESEISLAYDAADRLTQTYRRDGGQGRWQRSSSIGYDFLGRKTGMSDADLGSWSYAYNALGQLTRQTDARDRTSCLYFDSLGRMRGRVQRTDENCATTVTDADLDSSYVYDTQGRMQSESNDNVSRSFTYDSYSRVSGVSVIIDSLTRTSSISYDHHHRPTAVTYPGGEVITATYGSPGVAVGLSSSVHGALVDSVKYDEAGRMTAMRFPAGGNLWRTQSYYPWTEPKNGGMLAGLKVGLSEGGGERLSRGYTYNSFGDITSLTQGTTGNSFAYDGLGRLTSAYGRTYSYDAANRLTSFNGQAYGYGNAGPYHAVDRIGNADRFDYDANGNMTVRNKGIAGQQTLVWDAENRLSQVQDNNGDLLEQYWYDVDGARVKKTSGTTTTYTFFAHYEEEVSGVVTTTVSHYSFGGMRVAVKRGSDLYHLHGDHLGSTSLTTDGTGAATASRAYYAYGAMRSSSGTLQTDRTFTGQKADVTGLMYYNARYYDPALGTFISPDSMVPNPLRVMDYNRLLYVRGNPLKHTDPTGNCALDSQGRIVKHDCTVDDFKALAWEERVQWLDALQEEEADLRGWFGDIRGVITDLFIGDEAFENMEGYIAYMNAAVLQAINDGVRIFRGKDAIGHEDSKGWRHGGEQWATFFRLESERGRFYPREPRSTLDKHRLAAEQAGVDYARTLDKSQRLFEKERRITRLRIEVFLLGGDIYRAECPCWHVNPRQGWGTLRRLAAWGDIWAGFLEIEEIRGENRLYMPPP